MSTEKALNRGAFLAAAGGAAAVLIAACTGPSLASGTYPVTHSDAEWMKILGADRYYILREAGTEPANSSPLIAETRPGIYRCAGCALALFSSKNKYDSGDGWPSFWTVLPNATKTQSDFAIGEERTEVHCAQCGGHLGHIFDDGPPPTHLRYCIDGLALKFVPA
jgi:peptide-methionine (R)-S-oxide reductase